MRQKTFLLAFVISSTSKVAVAGMPSVSLTEVAAARLDVISFFVFGFFFCALLLKAAWNMLAEGITVLPKLAYKHALGLMLVSSLFLYVVLTMISGARELMTPGAWVKSGATYQLAPPDSDPKPWLDSARRGALEKLRDALWLYAASHGGNLPPHREVLDIAPEVWRGIHPQGDELAYLPGASAGKGHFVVAYEPESFGSRRYVLLSDGSVSLMAAASLETKVQECLKAHQP